MIEVRIADAEDAGAIATAHVEAWRVAYRGIVADDFLDGNAFSDARHAGWVHRLTDGPPLNGTEDTNRIFVALLDEAVVGFGHVGTEADPVTGPDGASRFGDGGELYGFYLHPDAWGSGAADALMERCLATLAVHFDRAVLWVLTENPRARRFYERHGWECGDGENVVVTTWDGPVMPGLPKLAEPLPETQYRIRL